MINNRAKSFVAIMVVIALVSIFLRITIERIIKFNIAQNESDAQGTLKLIAASLESYAANNQGVYPASISLLTQPDPPYLDKDYSSLSPLKGYNYSCLRLEPSGYSCSAVPLKCNMTANTVYTVTTGSLLGSEECEKKEKE